MKLETVKVVRGDAFAIINKSDITDEDQIFGAEKPKQAKSTAKKPAVKKG